MATRRMPPNGRIAQFQRRGVDVVEIVGSDAAHARQLVDEARRAEPTPW